MAEVDSITTYRVNGRVYLVVDNDFTYVYEPDGSYIGAGEAFWDYLEYINEDA